MKDILNESLTDYVYHFTTMSALDKIITYNRIELSDATASNVDMACQPEGYRFYLSFTSQSNPYVGYANKINSSNKKRVDETDDGKYSKLSAKKGGRLRGFGADPLVRRRKYAGYDKTTPDGELTYAQKISSALNNRFKIKPTTKYVDKNGDIVYAIDKNQAQNRNGISANSESEQRMFSKTRTFNNVFDYIERIDIFPIMEKLDVRICFNGKKISSDYKCGPVDYIYQLYKYAVSKGTLDNDTSNVIGLSVGEIPKKTGRRKKSVVSEAELKAKDFFKSQKLKFLRKWVFEIKTEKKSGKDTYSNQILKWADKIFVHTDSTGKSSRYGVNSILKYGQKLGVVSLNMFSDLVVDDKQRNKKTTVDKTNLITPSKVKEILQIIFALTPSFNDNMKKKIDYCCKVIDSYFGGIKVTFSVPGKNTTENLKLNDVLTNYLKTTPSFIEEWISKYTTDSKNFNGISRLVNRLGKTYKGPFYNILASLDNFIINFSKQNGVPRKSMFTYQWNKEYNTKKKTAKKEPKTTKPKTTKANSKATQQALFTEGDVKDMVRDVLTRLNE